MKPRMLLMLLCAAAFPVMLSAAAEIRQLDPPEDVLLGQPVPWILQTRHPMWESYDLVLQPPTGMILELEDVSYRREQDTLVTVYRVRMMAQSLAVGGPPAAILKDEGGEIQIIRGKPIEVRTISGDSMDVRDPEIPRFKAGAPARLPVVLGIALAVLLALLVFRWWLRRRAGTPRQTLWRNLKEIQIQARGNKLPDPAWLCILFRSELLWGESVDAATVAELAERGKRSKQHEVLSGALETWERARYSGNYAYDAPMLEKSVNAAMEILNQ